MRIAKAPRKGILGHDAKAQLIGDQHDRAVLRRQRGAKPRGFRVRVMRLEQIRQPERQAVDQPHPLPVRRGQRRTQIARFFDRLPARPAHFAVPGDASRHFFVTRRRGGNIDARHVKLTGDPLGQDRFARTGTTCDKNDA